MISNNSNEISYRYRNLYKPPKKADKVWEILGRRFAEIEEWFSAVSYSKAIPMDEVPSGIKIAPNAPIAGRITKTKALRASEFLTMYSDEKREFIFEALGTPKWILYSNTNHSKVIENGLNSCTLVFDIEMKFTLLFSFLSGILKKRIDKIMAQLHAELKYYAETDEIMNEREETF